jgi:hypothetical protein
MGVAGIFIFIGSLVYIFYFKTTSTENGIILYVDYKRLGIVENGSPVKMGFNTIGFIDGVSLVRKKKTSFVRIKLWIDKRYAKFVYTNSKFYFESISLIGLRHININLPPENEKLGEVVKTGDIIRGEDPAYLDHLLKLTYDSLVTNLSMISEFKDDWDKLFENVSKYEIQSSWLSNEIFPLTTQLFNSAKNLRKATWFNELNKNRGNYNILVKLLIIDNIIKTKSKNLKSIIALIEKDFKIWNDSKFQKKFKVIKNKIDSVIKHLVASEKQIIKIGKKLNSKTGVIGSLLKDRELYDDLKQMAKRLKNAPLDLIFKRKEIKLYKNK